MALKGDLHVATEEERGAQLKDDLLLLKVDCVDFGQEGRDKGLEDLELKMS